MATPTIFPLSTVITSAGRALLDDATHAAQRATLGVSHAINAANYGYATTATAAVNATALLAAITAANLLGCRAVVPGIVATVGALGTLPVSGWVRLEFEDGAELNAPGLGLTVLSDITLMRPTTSFSSKGKATFRGYRRGFDFDDIASGAIIEAEDMTFEYCGRVYNYTQIADREDFTSCFGCMDPTANSIESVTVKNFNFNDYGGRVCDFGVMWRSPFNRATASGMYSTGMQRIGVMLGDQTTWEVCKNITVDHLVMRDIYPRYETAVEHECHAYLLYGLRVTSTKIMVDNVYDLLVTGNDSEAGYIKGLWINASDIHVRDGGIGNGFLTFKGIRPTTAELLDLDALGGDIPKNGLINITNVTLHASASFTATYGRISGMYIMGTKVNIGVVNTTGSFDRAIDCAGGSVNISGPITITGDSNNAILVQAEPENPSPSRIANVSADGVFTGGIIEFRMANADQAVTMPLVEISNCSLVHRGTVAVAGLFNISIEKSAYQQTLTKLKIQGCSAHCTANTGAGASPAFAFRTGGGSGANEGIISRVEISDCGQDGGSSNYAFIGLAGKIVDVVINGGSSGATNAFFTSPTIPTTLRVRNVVGTYTSEKTGTGTVAAGSTSVVITPGFSASRQSNMYPTAINQIRITPGDMGLATKWWVSAVTGGAFQMNTDAAPGGSGFTFGYEAYNGYYG